MPTEIHPALASGERRALIYDRLYTTAGIAHALNRITLPGDLGEAVTPGHAETMGIYQILREVLGIAPARAEFAIVSELPDAVLARQLCISPSTPLLILDRISFDAGGRAIERTRHHLLPDVYRLTFGLSAEGTAAG